MSYTDSQQSFLRGKVAFVQDNQSFYNFDSLSQSWKKVGIVNSAATTFNMDSGIPKPVYPNTFNYEDDALALSINLTNEDSDGNVITWNTHTHTGNGVTKNPALLTFSNNQKITVTPQNVETKDEDGKVTNTNIGGQFYVSLYTSDSPKFTTFDPPNYNTTDGNPQTVAEKEGDRPERGRYELTLQYDYDQAQVIAFNTPKVLDLIDFGTATTFFSGTPQGTALTSNTGFQYKEEITLPNPGTVARLYRLQGTSVTQYDNPSANKLSELHSSNDVKGTYNFNTSIVNDASGVSLNSTGTKMHVLNTSATTHPPRTLVEYDLTDSHNVTSAVHISSQYPDVYVGTKSKIRKSGKYLYSLRQIDIGNSYTSILSSPYHRAAAINIGGTDWPKRAYLYRYTLDSDLVSADAGTIHKTSFDHDQVLDLYTNHAFEIATNTVSGWNASVTNGATMWGDTFHYFPHFGPVVSFDMDSSGTNLYTITAKARDRGKITKYNLGAAYDLNQPNASSRQQVDHKIGVGQPDDFLANWKTNGVWDIKVSKDGKKIFILDCETHSIYQYNMTTAHDLTTLNRTELLTQEKAVDANGYDARLQLTDVPTTATFAPLTFDSEGEVGMPNIDGLSTNLRQNAVQNNNFRDFSMVRSFDFRDDGLRLFVANDQEIYQYNLSTGYDISTAAFSSSTDTYASYLGNKDMILGTSIDFDSADAGVHVSETGDSIPSYQKLWISSQSYDLNPQATGVVTEFNLTDSIGSGKVPYRDKIYLLDSDGWGDMDVKYDPPSADLYFSGPNKIKRLKMIGDSIGTITTDSNYRWDSVVRFGGNMIAVNPAQDKIFVSDSNNTIRTVGLGSINDSVTHTGQNFTTVTPDGGNTTITGMHYLTGGKNFFISGNNQLEHYKNRDSFFISDI